MPYGLSHTPLVFQCLINDVLRDKLGKFKIAYTDDILIYSLSLESHVIHTKKFLSCLLKHQLYLKRVKCEFNISTISFLGYIISREDGAMDEAKVVTVTEWPIPKTIKELQHFIGFASFYRSFIRGFSSITIPLMSLLKKSPKLNDVEQST